MPETIDAQVPAAAQEAAATQAARALAQRPGMYSWLRVKKKFPHLWCPGCGLGTVLNTFTRALIRQGYRKDDVVVVSGIGCTGRIPVYLDCNTLHTTHGRALTFATGIKLANPKLKVIVFMGDGDALAIGGNHFIHACRRNIGLTAVVVNNAIYGMTGGQVSPTTPLACRATTAPLGNIDPPFDTCSLAMGAGATFVARATVYHINLMEKLMCQAMQHDGFSVLEIVSHCHTYFGRLNKLGGHLEMLRRQRERSVTYAPGLDIEKARAEGKDTVIGVFKEETGRKEYCAAYERQVIRPAMASKE
jgi:2-oxoglutarate/2-oxoacid ferredoxin oxidoreductase subunit beta